MLTLADRIKEAFGNRKPAEIARAVKRSKGAVTQWLDGTTKSLKADTADAMETATGYRAAWIISGKGPKLTAESSRKGAVFKEPTPEEWELLAHWRHLLSKDKKAKLKEIAQLAEEREAEKKELFEDAGVTEIMERAAHAARGRPASASVKPGDPRLKQQALPFEAAAEAIRRKP
jgi:hypothetical protein